MINPQNIKYKKMHLGKLKGIASKNKQLIFGTYGFQAITSNWISSKQLDISIKILKRYIKKIGKFWLKIFPYQSVTTRATDSRMGSGKGNVSHWLSAVKSGTILFEFDNISFNIILKLFQLIKAKLPLKLKLIKKDD